MRAILIPPAFTPYKDESPFSTIYLCQQIGIFLQRAGWNVELFGINGSTSPSFLVREFDGIPQPSIIDTDVCYSTNTALTNIISAAVDELASGECGAVINFGHDGLPYSVDEPGFLNVVTFSAGVEQQIDQSISSGLSRHPERFGFISASQAAAFGAGVRQPLYCPVTVDPLPAGAGADSLLFAGRVTYSKGIQHAVQLGETTGIGLTVAGQCEFTAGIESILSAPGVRFLGCLDRVELYRTMRQSTALVQLQQGDVEEAFGMVTAEAMCTGLPVITWECGANTELVSDEDGVIVTVGDIEAAARAVITVTGWGYDRREAIRKRSLSRFSLESVGERYLQWIESAIK